MTAVPGRLRIGAVGYLNARPLTWFLDRTPDRWAVRYDVPSVCATLLHDDDVDLGLIPSVEYLQRPDYRLVPGVGIGSAGPVASVALYSRVPVESIRRLALESIEHTLCVLQPAERDQRFDPVGHEANGTGFSYTPVLEARAERPKQLLDGLESLQRELHQAERAGHRSSSRSPTRSGAAGSKSWTKPGLQPPQPPRKSTTRASAPARSPWSASSSRPWW